MTTLQTLRFFLTPEHQCSYLDDKAAQTLFVDPQMKVDQKLYSQLSDLGFRRSGTHIYRPHCRACNACISVRIPTRAFSPSRSQKRVLSKNRDLWIETVEPCHTDEIYALYERYINQRHADGDMFPPSETQFKSFLVDSSQSTEFHLIRDQAHQLLGVAVTDSLDTGLSAVYTFFEPTEEHRSLGTYAILTEIQRVNQLKLDYLYLGYWVGACAKMDYKTHFTPIEQLKEGVWTALEDSEIDSLSS